MFVRTELNFDELQMTKEKPEFIIRMGNTVELVVTVAVTGKRRYCNFETNVFGGKSSSRVILCNFLYLSDDLGMSLESHSECRYLV